MEAKGLTAAATELVATGEEEAAEQRAERWVLPPLALAAAVVAMEV